MLRMEDIGPLAYGGLKTGADWWDEQRIADGTLTDADIMKKASTYAYLVPGGAATIMSAFGVWRRQEKWLESISHGFMYGFPGWIREVVKTMTPAGAKSAAVREASRIVRNPIRQLAQGASTQRSYQREFESVAPNVF